MYYSDNERLNNIQVFRSVSHRISFSTIVFKNSRLEEQHIFKYCFVNKTQYKKHQDILEKWETYHSCHVLFKKPIQ